MNRLTQTNKADSTVYDNMPHDPTEPISPSNPLMNISRYNVVFVDGQWKVQLNGNTLSTHRKKSAARREARRLAENKAERTNDAVRLAIFKKNGQNQRTIDISRKR